MVFLWRRHAVGGGRCRVNFCEAHIAQHFIDHRARIVVGLTQYNPDFGGIVVLLHFTSIFGHIVLPGCSIIPFCQSGVNIHQRQTIKF